VPDVNPRRPHVRSSGRGSRIAIRLRKSRQSQSSLPVLSKTSALGSRRVESAASWRERQPRRRRCCAGRT